MIRECVRTGAVDARTRRSLGHHLLHQLFLRLLVLCAPLILRPTDLFYIKDCIPRSKFLTHAQMIGLITLPSRWILVVLDQANQNKKGQSGIMYLCPINFCKSTLIYVQNYYYRARSYRVFYQNRKAKLVILWQKLVWTKSWSGQILTIPIILQSRRHSMLLV